MIHIQNPSDCCGCSACASICPRDAISMEPDSMGFLYPKVDMEKCVDCGLCERVCAFGNHYDVSRNLTVPKAYAIRHKDLSEVETSRSGAAFIALTDWILHQGGVVYGAGYADHFRVVHKRAATKQQRDEFKGSKYVQSDMGNVFRQVRADLKNGFKVLFSGTPCQTSGLLSFIGNRLRDNLYVVDIVCHGVPSPYIWKDYLAYQEHKNNCVFDDVSFRNKSICGWADHKESFSYKGKVVVSSIYTRLFYKHIMFRHSCGVCHFTNLKRSSDITIADFWGWEKTDANINKDNKGVSLVFVNTEKGVDWLSEINTSIHIIPVKIDNCLQPNLQRPSEIHPKRDDFEKDYSAKGLDFVLHKYGIIGYKYNYSVLKRKFRTLIRLICKR